MGEEVSLPRHFPPKAQIFNLLSAQISTVSICSWNDWHTQEVCKCWENSGTFLQLYIECSLLCRMYFKNVNGGPMTFQWLYLLNLLKNDSCTLRQDKAVHVVIYTIKLYIRAELNSCFFTSLYIFSLSHFLFVRPDVFGRELRKSSFIIYDYSPTVRSYRILIQSDCGGNW